MLFAALLFVWADVRLAAGAWPPDGEPRAPLVYPAVATVLIAASSWMLARRRLVAHRRCSALGFVAVQLAGWAALWRAGVTPSSGRYGSLLYTFCALHALHVVVGLGGPRCCARASPAQLAPLLALRRRRLARALLRALSRRLQRRARAGARPRRLPAILPPVPRRRRRRPRLLVARAAPAAARLHAGAVQVRPHARRHRCRPTPSSSASCATGSTAPPCCRGTSPTRELDDVVQYIKTFSPRWRTEQHRRSRSCRRPIRSAKRAPTEAIAHGESSTNAQCAKCHEHRELKVTDYCLRWKRKDECEQQVRELPPDLRCDPLAQRSTPAGARRSLPHDRGGHRRRRHAAVEGRAARRRLVGRRLLRALARPANGQTRCSLSRTGQ